MTRIGSLCSGYEGLGMAVQAVLGGEVAWVADNDPGAAQILAERYPGVPNLGDITTIDWRTILAVAVLLAGFPCQDVSAAGARAGLQKGNRSGLWLQIVEAIRVLRPGLVIIENVRGLLTARGDEPTPEHLAAEASALAAMRLLQWLDNETSLAYFKGDDRRVQECQARTARVMGLRRRALARCEWHERRLVRAIGTVLGSLASLGYDTCWTVVSATDAGAPHRRERVFILAWPAADAKNWGQPELASRTDGSECWPARADGARLGQWPWTGAGDRTGAGHNATRVAKDPDRSASRERRLPAPGQEAGRGARADTGGPGGAPVAADAERIGHKRAQRANGTKSAGWAVTGERDRPARSGGAPADADGAPGGRNEPGSRPSPLQGTAVAERPQEQPGRLHSGSGNASPVAAEWGAYEPAIRRWETAVGRPAPGPTEPGRTGERLSPRFVEWMMGLPDGWVTGVPGLSRNAQLKALGNGVVPQQAELALRLLLAQAFGTETAA
jgi:site-specific DNA-cytosine methylase